MVKKVIYDFSSREVMQEFAHRRMQFYEANFEQNILFGHFHLTAKYKAEKCIAKETFFKF